MVASRSDTKRRRRDSSPLDSNPKRTKVHAQRKFAQGVTSLSNLLNLTPVKEKPDKSRNNGLGGNPTNGLKETDSTEGPSHVTTTGKRALPARGAKKPSIEEMITFLCYRGTSALPPHLAHLNKAPSPEPVPLSQLRSSENRSKPGDKANREGEKGNNKKALKTAASAPKAVTTAQALKKKYQEQRIKKTTVSTITSKVKATPLLRTTRSSAEATANLFTKAAPKKIVVKKTEAVSPSKKKDSSAKDDSVSKASVRTPTSRPSVSKTNVVAPSSGSRGGLRSGGVLSENILRSGAKKLGSSVVLKKKKKKVDTSTSGSVSPQSKKFATSLSDFSSEDDQPLVKKPKPLVQVHKLIKKSIANIGRKMKLEPRRSKRGLTANPSSPNTAQLKRSSGGLSKHPQSSSAANPPTSSKDDDVKGKGSKKSVSASKEMNGVSSRSTSQDSMKKDNPSASKSSLAKMKKGYVMELVRDNDREGDATVETRSRRGSRDVRDVSADEKVLTNQSAPETPKRHGIESKKKDSVKSSDQSKKVSGTGATPKALSAKQSGTVKNQVDMSLTAVPKILPDLRIPPSIKRPLAAVGLTNSMAIAAAAAVVCKTSSTRAEDREKSKDPPLSRDASKDKKGDAKKKDLPSSPSISKDKLSEDEKIVVVPSKAKQSLESKISDTKKDFKPEKSKVVSCTKKKPIYTSDDESKQANCVVSKDSKNAKIKIESSDAVKETVKEESLKPLRSQRKSGLKALSEEDEANSQGAKTAANSKKNSDDDSKLSSRARRSNARSMKRDPSSEEEESLPSAISHEESKLSALTRKKVANRGNYNESRKRSTRQAQVQPSDDDIPGSEPKKATKNLSKTLIEDSSENEPVDSNDSSDDASVSKPSTRSAAKSNVGETKPSRMTRSGKRSCCTDEDNSAQKQRQKSGNHDTTSGEESDSLSPETVKAPKTRSKAVKNSDSKRGASSAESSSDETDSKSTPLQSRRIRRPTTSKKTSRTKLKSSSSGSATSSSEDDDYNNDSRSKSKANMKTPKLDLALSTRKSTGKQSESRNSRNKLFSDDDSDGKKTRSEVEKGKRSKSKGDDDIPRRRSQSPRRSSRKSLHARTHDSVSDSSVSDASSSESSHNQNRRVLRERRGFFSFAEVDPHSDFEEDILAATKASLEMINSPKSSETASQVETKKSERPLSQSPVPSSQEYDNSKRGKSKSEATKEVKKSKMDAVQPKKGLSKKRVKPANEVQPDLNEELEKTLMSINLSPQVSKTIDKSPDGTTLLTFGDLACVSSPKRGDQLDPVDSTSAGKSLHIISPQPASTKQNKVVSKSAALEVSPGSSPLPGPKLKSSPATPLLSTVHSNQTPALLASCIASMVPSTMGSTIFTSKGMKPSSASSVTPAPTTSMTYSSARSSVASVSISPTVTAGGVLAIAAGNGLTTTTLSAAQVTPVSLSGPVPLLPGTLSTPMHVPVPTAMASTMSSAMAVPIPSASVQAPLPGSMALPISAPMPVSMPITLNTQLGIPLQTSGNLPLSVPMSGTMTLPLQMGPLPSGTSATAPFLLPMQSTLTSMLAPGQAIIKKESGTLGGMPTPVGNASPLMVGMNPLVVNSNRGTFFLSTGSTMAMASSQQQMVSGSLMPSLLSLRLPDKPAGQQTIVASSPVYVPLYANTGIIQTQGQVQPQIQTMAGVSTITAMATNIQNAVGTNISHSASIHNTVTANIQNTMTTNIQNTVTNVQNSAASNMQSTAAANLQNSASANIPIATSVSSTMTLTQSQASGVGTGMKRQLVLATKNGPVSKLILSVGEDGSHVLAAANPNTVTTEGQTLMSVMQPVQPLKPSGQVTTIAASQSFQAKPPMSAVAQKLTSGPLKGMQPLLSNTSGQVLKLPISQSSNLTTITSERGAVCSSIPGTSSSTSGCIRTQPSSLLGGGTCLSSATGVHSSKPGLTFGATNQPSSSSTISTSNFLSASASNPLSSNVSTAGKTSISPIFPVSSSVTSNSSAVPCSSRGTTQGVRNPSINAMVTSRAVPGAQGTYLKPETKLSTTMSIRPICPSTKIISSTPHLSRATHSSPNVSSATVMAKMSSVTSVVPGSAPAPSRPVVSRPSMTVTSGHLPTSPVKTAVAGSPLKTTGTSEDLKSPGSTQPVLTSRIPSAPAALAALKGAPASSRAVAKTGSSRKPYSTAGSYAPSKTLDPPVPIENAAASSVFSGSMSPSQGPVTSTSLSSASPARVMNSNPALSTVTTVVKPSSSHSAPPLSKLSVSPTVLGNVELKRKGTEVELAPTHRTLSMLSTAFQGMSKERKRDVAVKKTIAVPETSGSSEKRPDKLNLEKSGLDSLAEVATSLAERSVDSSACDKRAPEHSLWTNPAQILGRETLRVPGLPITANIGTNLPTKNELAKMKSGAVLADAVEKRPLSDIEKSPKVKANSSSTEKPSVSGLLASSKADTPRQKVQKWLDDGSKRDVEHMKNCGLLSNGSSCTCDGMEEDISNLNSLADLCVSMERINSPVKDTKTVKQGSKLSTEKKKKQDLMEPVISSPQASSSSAKPSPPLNSHQMKVTWQNAFGVKSPSRSSKPATSTQGKRAVTSEDTKKTPSLNYESSDKNRKNIKDKTDHQSKSTLGINLELNQSKKYESSSSGSADEPAQERKSLQRRSLLGRVSVHQSKHDSSAFSADNESSVYAFEADTDTPPVSQPFRRRSKTLSRSDEEDSTSVGSTSNPVAVHVSKDPVFIPIQLESDENSSPLLLSSEVSSEKNGMRSDSPQNDDSDVYYIPLGGQEGSGDDVRAVAVRLGKDGPNNRVVMSAKLVKKPPTFKHPNDSNEDGLPNKRAKMEAKSLSPVAIRPSSSQTSSEPEASSNMNSPNKSRKTVDKKKSKQRETPQSSTVDSSSEDTSSLSHMPSSSKDLKESRLSMSPASSRNRSPMSDKASPASPSQKKGQGRMKRQSSVDSDISEKAKVPRRGSKSKSASSRASPSPSLPSTSSTSSGPSRPSQKSNRSYNGPVPGNVSEAPVFHPTEKEFQDPYAYIEKIRPTAEKYGLCRIVAPNSFKPDCNVEDDIRFTADNQYVHKMMDRWGPNAKEMRAIVKYIAQHNINLKHAPLVGGMELDLPRLYTTVQNFGGLMEVMDKKKWTKVAETMRIPKSAQDRASKLDEVYCKFLLPYETLRPSERDNLFEMVEVEWDMRKERREKRLNDSAAAPNQPGASDQAETPDQSGASNHPGQCGTSNQPAVATNAHHDDEEEDEEEDVDDEEDECIVKGRSMPLTTFYRTARNTIHMWFKGNSPSASEVEHEFWRHVRDRNFHICVNSGSVDCSDPPYGFPTRNSPFAKHPWNLKVFSNNNGSVLRSLGSVIGVTVPTLHFWMVFTTCCWYRDPHGLPWMEYLHTGAKKIWYGIPEHGAEKFREAMLEVAPHYVRKKALWLASDTAMIPPSMLTERKVPLCRTVQEPGQFIVVFPRAHTSSVATGYIVSESVSFAPPSWLSTALASFREMQACHEPPLFSLEKLVFAIAEDSRASLHVLNLLLPCVMDILEKEITNQADLKKRGVTMERIERSKKKSGGKKIRTQKDLEDMEVMECDVCSANLHMSVVFNAEEEVGYCLNHAIEYIKLEKLDVSQCKLLYIYNQNDMHEFCQNLLDKIETKSGKKGNSSSSESSPSTSSKS